MQDHIFAGRCEGLSCYGAGPFVLLIAHTQYNKYMTEETLLSIISEARRNGYMKQIKDISASTRCYDTQYRKKAASYYSKKTTKQFKLREQPEYLRERRFNSDFKAFVKGIPQFEAIREGDNHAAKPKLKISAQTLEYDPDKKCVLSAQNKKRRMFNTLNLDSMGSVANEGSIFPTFASAQLSTHKKQGFSPHPAESIRNNYNQSRIQIEVNQEATNRSRSQVSPFRSPAEVAKIALTQAVVRRPNPKSRSNNSNKIRSTQFIDKSINSQHSGGQFSPSHQQAATYINEIVALQTLNKLAGTEHKHRNFRITKAKLHELIVRKFGQDILTNFYGLQSLEDFSGVIKFCREILSADFRLACLITFITFDLNQDGVITEDEIVSINNMAEIDSGLAQDVRVLVDYSKVNPNLKCQPDLPQDFLRNPSYKQYLKTMSMGGHAEKEYSQLKGIFRLLSCKYDQEERESQKRALLEQKQLEHIRKKNIQINFTHFLKAFEVTHQSRPHFIKEFVMFLVGKNYETKMQQTQQLQIRMSLRSSNRRLKRFNTSTLETIMPAEENKLGKARQILSNLQGEHRNLTTVQFI